ncbi:hypothetical protein [Clostridium chrysemydis]|uniref:hypothetical protein n=1 Tax=Clostridium chrysemydis TaxID=2665504 RepID=UPI0018844C31|nr:hypothetical protein [Clostridium chrysemydis]
MEKPIIKKIIPFIVGIDLAETWRFLLKDVGINYFFKWLIEVGIIITAVVVSNKIKQRKSVSKNEI